MKRLPAAFLLSALAVSAVPPASAASPESEAADSAAADAEANAEAAAEAIEDLEFDDEDERDDPFELSAADLREFSIDTRLSEIADVAPALDEWRTALQRELAGRRLAEASRRLASAYGMAPKAMEELTRLWLIAEVHQYEFDEGSE